MYGVDLITFFHSDFWRVADADELVAKSQADPLWFWDRTLDSIRDAGLTGLELTFPPGDWRSAVKAYSSIEGFRQAMETRGLELISGFLVEVAFNDWRTAEGRAKILDAAAEYAEFISRAGGRFMVAGLPMRQSWDTEPPFFVDLKTAEQLADLIHHIGAITLRHGVRLALHTEAHSVFCTSRDVDLFMTLTDPTYVSMCPDTGHMVLAGSDPVHVMDRHRERLALAHWKDAIGPSPAYQPIDDDIHENHREYFRRVGTGTVDWFSWTRLLRQIDYSGPTLLELDASPDPIAEMTEARRFLEASVSHIR